MVELEVDPSVVRIAEDYFGYEAPPNHHVYVRDARVFLRGSRQTYDVIWVDVFARHLIPFHLTTQEFFERLHARLAPDGVLVVNLASSGEGPDRLRVQAVVATMKTVFPTIESFGVRGPWGGNESRAENLLFFAGETVEQLAWPEFRARVRGLTESARLPAEAISLLASRRSQAWPSGLVLTDDYAPYDILIGHEAPPAPFGGTSNTSVGR